MVQRLNVGELRVKVVQGTIVSSSKPLDEWDEGLCLCQGKVPDNKRIDVQQRVFDEKRQKHRWKAVIRFHQDCPVHGCEPKENK